MTEKRALIEFLKLFKESPCLWDQSHSLYTNRDARSHAHNKLLECFTCYQKDANIEMMKKKLDNMRTTCKREHKKVLAARSKGYDHRPTLWYYDLLSFIYNADDDNLIDCNDDENVELYQCDHTYGDYEEFEPKKIKLSDTLASCQSNNDDTDSKCTNDSANQPSSINNEEAMAFGTTVGLQLKELDNLQRIIAEKLISDTIFYARINKLTTNTTLSIN